MEPEHASPPPADNAVRVSVLLRTYNQRPFIAEAIESAVRQETSFPFEIIVGDDCSTDGTRDIVTEYSHRYAGLVRTVLPDQRLGKDGLMMFATLLAAASGEYVAPMDGDDFWTDPLKLEQSVQKLDANPGLSMCFHNVIQRDDSGREPDRDFNPADEPLESGLEELLRRCYIAASAPVLRRRAIFPLPEWYFESTANDWPLYILATTHGRVGYLPKTMGVYRVLPSGAYHKLARADRLRMCVGVFEAMNGGLFEPRDATFQSRRAEEWLSLAEECLRIGEFAEARRSALMAIRVVPALTGRIGRASIRAMLRSVLGTDRRAAPG